MKTFEYNTIQKVLVSAPVKVQHSVVIPEGFKIMKAESVYMGTDFEHNRELIFAVPENCEVELCLKHYDYDDNWEEEYTKLPKGSLVLIEDQAIWFSVSEYFMPIVHGTV